MKIAIEAAKGMIAAVCALLSAGAWADWHRAESSNFVIYADMTEADLRAQVQRLEGFDHLLRLRFGITGTQPQYPLTIHLLDKTSEVDKLAGPRRASGFYRTGRYGSWAVASLEDRGPIGPRSQEDVLLHEYTHHFFFRHVQTQRPPWYVEGFAQYFATATRSPAGEWTVGAVAGNRAAALLKGERIPIRDLLTARPQELARGETSAFYARSWLLVHMLYADPQRQQALQAYLTALGRNEEPLPAAQAAFGDLDALDRAVNAYLKTSLRAVTYDPIGQYAGPLRITRLDPAEAALVRPALYRRAGLDLAASRRDLEDLAANYPQHAEAWFELALTYLDLAAGASGAEAAAALARSETAIDRALAIKPGHGRANLLKGELRLRALSASGDQDPGKWREMRAFIYAANQADPNDPAPLFTWYDSYLRQGKPPTETARAGLARAFALQPEVPDLRTKYAFDLARNGNFDQARALIMVLGGDPHRAGRVAELITQLEQMRQRPGSAKPE